MRLNEKKGTNKRVIFAAFGIGRARFLHTVRGENGAKGEGGEWREEGANFAKFDCGNFVVVGHFFIVFPVHLCRGGSAPERKIVLIYHLF